MFSTLPSTAGRNLKVPVRKKTEEKKNSEKEIPFVKWPWCWVQFPSVPFSFHFSVHQAGTNLLEKTDIIQGRRSKSKTVVLTGNLFIL